MKISLVTTVKDAGDRIGAFLTSLAAQTRAPDEVVIVDGGSTDGTVEVLREAEGITLIEEPGANISRGRNIAIAAATHDVIAVSDADCVLEPDWLERLSESMEAGADVAMGFYRPMAESFFQTCVSAINIPDAGELDAATFFPSHRSVAFTRASIERADGYPEWLDIGEDSYVNRRFRTLGLDMRFVPDAVAHWPIRPTLVATWKQYFRYARGDAIAGMNPDRNAIRFASYSGALFAWSSRRRLPKLLAVLAAGTYAARPIRRALDRFDDPADRAKAVVAVPALMAFTDVAKIAGYGAGLLAQPRRV